MFLLFFMFLNIFLTLFFYHSYNYFLRFPFKKTIENNEEISFENAIFLFYDCEIFFPIFLLRIIQNYFKNQLTWSCQK